MTNVQANKGQYTSTDENLKSETGYDAFGRQVLSQVSGAATIQTTTVYDGHGRVYRQCNPQQSGTTSATDGCTTFTYDALGRVTKAEAADGSQTTASYTVQTSPSKARVVTVTDPAGVRQKLVSDAFGRLIEVDEAGPGYVTTYSYDMLDNLTGVTQGGQSRQFTYDSLKRVLSAKNPESGLSCFEYDANGNLFKRTDGAATRSGTPSGVTRQQTYDSLNRPSGITYNDGTPAVAFCYDGFIYSAGACASQSSGQKMRKTGSGNSVASTSYTYDKAGRVTGSTQSMAAAGSYSFVYTYYNDDRLSSIRYPSTRIVATCYDANGRVTWLSSNRTPTDCVNKSAGTSTYATVEKYWPHGVPNQMTLGNGVVEDMSFNSRLQVLSVQASKTGTLLSIGYGYGSANNGNVLQQTISVPTAAKVYYQYYQYDGANRLLSASEYDSSNAGPKCPDVGSQWCEKYGYTDHPQFGNRLITDRSHLTTSQLEPGAFDATNNRMTTGALTRSFTYSDDGRGSVKKDPVGATYSYDAENRLIAYCPNGQTPCTDAVVAATGYKYDGDGYRVQKKTETVVTTYVYDAEGRLAAEYGAGGGTSSGTQYLTQDALGSTRLITDSSGSPVERRDYYPFGGTIIATTGNGRTCDVPANCPALGGYAVDGGMTLQFTGKERDAETGLDFFGARYFSGPQGRFTTPDPLGLGAAKPSDPHSWNMYGYGRNNPLLYVDPTGTSYQVCDSQGKCEEKSDDDFLKNYQKNNAYILANGTIYQRTEKGTQGASIGSYSFAGQELSQTGAAVVEDLGSRADASNQMTGIVAGGSTVVGAGATAIGLTGLIGEGVISIAPEAATAAVAAGQASTYVSRWGRAGLEAGDWVMNGTANKWNYFWSGKWQRGFGNEFAPFSSGQTFLAPKSTVQNPGWMEQGLGWLKSLLGQRVYRP